jgi:hypothetical protein
VLEGSLQQIGITDTRTSGRRGLRNLAQSDGGGLYRGVSHSSCCGREDQPPLSYEARRGGSSCFNHDCTTTEEPSDQPSYSDHSTTAGDTAVRCQPPPRVMARLSRGRIMTEQTSRRASGGNSRPTRTTITQASSRRKDPHDGLHRHLSSIRRSDFHPTQSTGPGRGHNGLFTATHRR